MTHNSIHVEESCPDETCLGGKICFFSRLLGGSLRLSRILVLTAVVLSAFWTLDCGKTHNHASQKSSASNAKTGGKGNTPSDVASGTTHSSKRTKPGRPSARGARFGLESATAPVDVEVEGPDGITRIEHLTAGQAVIFLEKRVCSAHLTVDQVTVACQDRSRIPFLRQRKTTAIQYGELDRQILVNGRVVGLDLSGLAVDAAVRLLAKHHDVTTVVLREAVALHRPVSSPCLWSDTSVRRQTSFVWRTLATDSCFWALVMVG